MCVKAAGGKCGGGGVVCVGVGLSPTLLAPIWVGVEKISSGTGRDHKNFGDSIKMYPIPAPTPIINDSSLKLLYVKNKYHKNLGKWVRSGI